MDGGIKIMKYVRKFSVFIISILSMCFIFGCGSEPTKSPAQVITDEIEGIKGGDREVYKNMFWHGMIDMDSDKSTKELFQNSSVKIDKAISDINYTVNSESISGDSAVVNVTLTGPELDVVWSELVNTVKKDISSGLISITNLNLEIIGERYDKIICDLLDNNMKTSTRTMDIKLEKKNGEWQINEDNLVKLTINMHPDKVKHVLNHI